MSYYLSYFNDFIAPLSSITLPEARRMIFAWRGASTVLGMPLEEGMATYADGEVTITAGDQGVMLFRWDLIDEQVKAPYLEALRLGSMLRMSRKIWSLELTEGSEWLFRLDMINNPPGLVADVHTHLGPGIRALLTGSFKCRQPSEDGTADCPGDPWWETGIEAVISTPDETEISKFLRCMILPVSMQGKGNSSVWHREKIEPPSDWPIWKLLVDEVIRL
jgi:hypothetical protein